ncbi:hypothetical protein SAMN04488598_1644 [Halanaerobium congolense]|uniref:Uncharacterized protein n=1 Tax=Halanaerobium congolense TaxID=54121 RepID=A0A1I0DBK6_9FIRM|nr:hypothetical protein [Halanaerobium congolense]PTX14559.1 hypothetical protein C7953_2982 [Halanaerobium congolense]SDG22066.1 hypothetical protein SAMN04488598_1644 [Halanaerobium congolense]SET28946.1 hypothetical protein SAMN04515652_1684 [Halanaerobium congolense]SFP79610.1 hypothetical protein SAMN04488596_1644 [Halanaerobium congolense]
MSEVTKKRCNRYLELEKGLPDGPGDELEENLIDEVIRHRNITLNWANNFLKRHDPIHRVCEQFLKETIYQALVDKDKSYSNSEENIYYLMNGKLHKAVITLVEVEKEELKSLGDWKKEMFPNNELARSEEKELNYSLSEDNLKFETVTDYIEQLKEERDQLLEQTKVVLNDYQVETGSMQVLREIFEEVNNAN